MFESENMTIFVGGMEGAGSQAWGADRRREGATPGLERAGADIRRDRDWKVPLQRSATSSSLKQENKPTRLQRACATVWT